MGEDLVGEDLIALFEIWKSDIFGFAVDFEEAVKDDDFAFGDEF